MQSSQTKTKTTVAGQDGPGDDSGGMDSGSNGLGNDKGAVGESRSAADDLRGDNRAEAVANGDTGETTGSGEGDSQDGSEDSLWRKL